MTMKTDLTMNHRKVRQEGSGVPMNRPTPYPSQEGNWTRASEGWLPSWEGLGVG